MVELASCAADVPIFRVLPPEALVELNQAMRHRHHERGTLVARAGEPVEALILVAEGQLKAVRSTAGGREQVVRVLGPGDFLGELALFAPARHDGDLVAVQPSDVCLVPRQAMQDLLCRHPELAVSLVGALAERLAQAEQLIADLGLREVGQRLAAMLLRLAEQAGTPGADGVRFRAPAPWAELAARLATTPESLSRRLAGLADQGVIRLERRRTVVILEPERLRALAEGAA